MSSKHEDDAERFRKLSEELLGVLVELEDVVLDREFVSADTLDKFNSIIKEAKKELAEIKRE